jgi:hypothetical protein
MSDPELHVVVEIGTRPERLWFHPPADPWPHFVRLWGSSTVSEVELFLVVASTYGRASGSPASSIAEVLAEFPDVLPGGIGAILDGQSVMPSCCCGLESWPEWQEVLITGQSPWTGHDPAPLVEVDDFAVRVWSDGGMGEKPSDEAPITFTRSAFELAVAEAAHDLREFLKPLDAWFKVHAPHASQEFAAKFAARFIDISSI